MRSERVLDSRRHLDIICPLNQTVPFQFSELLYQHLLTHTLNSLLKHARSLRSTLQVVKDERLPLTPDQIHR